MNTTTLSFLAWRYIRGTSFSSSINTMIRISFLSIFIGTFSLTLVTCIMQGFEEETYKKLKGISPDITLEPFSEDSIDIQPLQHFIKERFTTLIKNTSPYASTTVGIVHPQTHDTLDVAFLKVIDPETSSFNTLPHTFYPTLPLSLLLQEKSLIVGEKLLKKLSITLPSDITIMYQEEQQIDQKPKKITLPITGYITTGIADIDEHIIICSFDTYKQFTNISEPTGLALELYKNTDHSACKKALEKELSMLKISSWKDNYPALVSALKLERYVMFFLLLLITLVASMNLLSLLFMIIHSKKTDCALLLSLGCTLFDLKKIFISFTLLLAACACLCGITLAYVVALLLKKYPFIQLPDAYYVTYLPVSISFSTGITVFFCALILSLLASSIALKNIHTLNIARIFRYE